ncbi:MAG: hypothetical protein FWD01_05055 [Defluviitaleaceae bacterium]|nr:hypothetical protein [Defluviitaleaceae bacterium]
MPWCGYAPYSEIDGFWLHITAMPLWIAASRYALLAMTGFGYTLPATKEILATRCRNAVMDCRVALCAPCNDGFWLRVAVVLLCAVL